MKWLIVEDALRDRKGHWLEYVSTFVRGLTALGDEVVVLCDRKAEGFILEQTGARPILPESIWHRMGDGAGALKRYLRVPGHAIATFFAMRKVFRGFNHNRARGQVRERATGGWPEGRGSGNERVKGHREHRVRQAEVSHSGTENGLLRTDESKHVPCSATETEPKEPATRHKLPATSSPPDWIFVPTVLVHHLLAWWMLLKTGSVPRESRVLLFFPNLPIRLDDSGRAFWTAGPTTKLMAWLFENLRGEVESGKVVLGVETHAMRRALEGLIRMPVVYLPHPVEFHTETRRRGGVESSEFLTTEDTESTEGQAGLRLSSQAGAAFSYPSSSKVDVSPVSESLTRSASIPASTLATSNSLPATAAKPLIFGCYGAARWEKGTDVLQAAIRLVLQEKPEIPANFVFQWLEDFKDEHGLCVSLDPWMREHPKVEVVERYFNEGEIHLRLAETDVMVLPYRKPYRLRVSRVVIEAMLNGMPVIATEDTTLLEQANEHGCGLACQEGSAESLARAILQAAANSDLMQRVAKEKAPEVQSNFSVDRFRQILMNQATERQRQ